MCGRPFPWSMGQGQPDETVCVVPALLRLRAARSFWRAPSPRCAERDTRTSGVRAANLPPHDQTGGNSPGGVDIRFGDSNMHVWHSRRASANDQPRPRAHKAPARSPPQCYRMFPATPAMTQKATAHVDLGCRRMASVGSWTSILVRTSIRSTPRQSLARRLVAGAKHRLRGYRPPAAAAARRHSARRTARAAASAVVAPHETDRPDALESLHKRLPYRSILKVMCVNLQYCSARPCLMQGLPGRKIEVLHLRETPRRRQGPEGLTDAVATSVVAGGHRATPRPSSPVSWSTRKIRRATPATPHEGPCIVEEYDATCVISPGAQAALDPLSGRSGGVAPPMQGLSARRGPLVAGGGTSRDGSDINGGAGDQSRRRRPQPFVNPCTAR